MSRQPSLFAQSRKKPDQREFRLHVMVADLLRLAGHRDLIWFAVPNGESRSEKTGARLKRMGVRRGVADFAFSLPGGRAAFLELKVAKGRQSEAQILFEFDCKRNGALYVVARSFDEVREILRSWGALRLSADEIRRAA